MRGMREGLFKADLNLTEHFNKFNVAVGIPAYNERGRIGRLLYQLLCQKDVQLREIIINISGSTDGTQDEIISTARCCNASSLVKVIDTNKREGKAAALDAILNACSSDIVIFLDADAKLHNGCLKEILKPFIDGSVGLVGGNVMPINTNINGDKRFFHIVSRLERQLHHQICMDCMAKKEAPKVNGTFFALRKHLVNYLPYNTVSDDEYFSWYVQHKGYSVVYAPDAIVYTKDPENFRDYISKRRRIFAGHFFLKKEIGYSVPTIKLKKVFPSLLKLWIKEKQGIFHLFTMLFLQFISYVFAIIDVISNNVPYCYRVESAKF